MLRRLSLLAALAITVTVAANGCRSCSSCQDYSKPVANCDCNACGTHRCGAAHDHALRDVCDCGGGCSSGGCSGGGCSSGQCSCGGEGQTGGGYVEGNDSNYETMAPGSDGSM